MADGRMLKKVICMSQKLAALKTDTARLLYTWLLPHLDIEGRFSGDPDVIKGYVFPRVKSITADTIQECLFDLRDCKLIKLYGIDGDVFLEFTKFSDHQSLRPEKEKKSIIPPANKAQPIDKTNDNPFTPGAGREQGGSCTAQDKIREEKIREDKRTGKPFDLPSWIPKETWDAYLEVRNKKRATKSTYALSLIIKELINIKEKYGHNPLTVLNKSIKSGWIDVFPIKDENKTQVQSSSRTSEATTKIPELTPFPDDSEVQEVLTAAREMRQKRGLGDVLKSMAK